MARTISDIQQDIYDAEQDVENANSILNDPRFADRRAESSKILQERISKLQKLKLELERANKY